MNKMLIGVKNINFLFVRDLDSPPLWTKNIDWDNNINFIFIATWSQTRHNLRVGANLFHGVKKISENQASRFVQAGS